MMQAYNVVVISLEYIWYLYTTAAWLYVDMVYRKKMA